jgi:hypothetical protein
MASEASRRTPGSFRRLGGHGILRSVWREYRTASRRRRGPELCDPGFGRVPLSREGKQELGVGTGDVNKVSRAQRTMCATVLTADELERLAA